MAIRPEIKALIDNAKNGQTVDVENSETTNISGVTSQYIRPEILDMINKSNASQVNDAPEQIENKTELIKRPNLGSKILGQARGIGNQFLKGVDVQTQNIGQLLVGGEQTEMMPNTGDAVGIPQKVARLAGEFSPTLATAGVPGVGFAATQLSNAIALKSAPVLAPIAKLANKSISFVGEVLSSVPREFMERAISKEFAGKSIFKGTKTYDELGKKAQKAINFIRDQAGKEVGEVKASLAGRKVKVNVEKIVNEIDDQIAKRTVKRSPKLQAVTKGGQINLDLVQQKELTSLKPKDIDFLNKVRADLLAQGNNQIDMESLAIIKTNLANEVVFDPQTVKKVSTEGKGIVKSIGGLIKKDMELAVPELKKVNEKFSKIADLQTRLGTKLKDENVAKNLRNLITKDAAIVDLFEELDAAAPNSFKFIEDLANTMTAKAFEEVFPGRGGGSGSAQGISNLLRTEVLGIQLGGALRLGTGGGAAAANPALIPLLPLLSPRGQRGAIKAVAGTAKLAGKIPPKVAGGVAGKTLLKFKGEAE